jgi:hypothetical protein
MLLLCLLAPLLMSCATTGPSNPPEPVECVPETKIVTQTKLVDTFCDVEVPIYVSKTDVLANTTAQQILAHNKYGAAKCGWKPTNK